MNTYTFHVTVVEDLAFCETREFTARTKAHDSLEAYILIAQDYPMHLSITAVAS